MRQDARLPLPDYDETPLSSLRHDVRALQPEEVHALLAHERAHGERAPYLQVLQARLEQLEHDATPSSGDPGAESSRPGDTPAGSPVTPAGAAESREPLRHGLEDQTRDAETH